MNTPRVTKDFLGTAMTMHDKLIKWRRHFHQNPELGFQEHSTQEYLVQSLREMGLQVQSGIGWTTSVIADLGKGKQAFAIRADMDALPLSEANETSYISHNPKVMHACGHDAHMAMALGSAYILSHLSDIEGRIRFIFQPAEETSDANGLSGSAYLIGGGALNDVRDIIAIHVDPEVSIGKVALCRDFISAAVDPFTAKIIGKGTHVASPEKGLSPIWLLSQVLPAIESIPSLFSPSQTSIVTVTTVHCGNKDNVIPDEATISGSIRYQDDSDRDLLHQALDRSLAMVKLWGGDYQLRISSVCRVTRQNPTLVTAFSQVASEILGTEAVQEKQIGLLGEDFGNFAGECNGAMLWVGIKQNDAQEPLHSAHFDLDENVLPIGTAILASMAYHFLKQNM
jgi:amidohydrolase